MAAQGEIFVQFWLKPDEAVATLGGEKSGEKNGYRNSCGGLRETDGKDRSPNGTIIPE